MTLKDKIVRGFAWSALAKIVIQLFSWVSTFVVIRHLAPSDYGIVAVAFAVMSIFTIIGECGLADAVIQKKTLAKNNVSQAFSLSLLINLSILISVYIFSELIAEFYDYQGLSSVLVFLAANLALMSFVTIPEAIMNRKLYFKKRALIETLGYLVNTIVTLAFALNEGGYWSILFGFTANTLTKVVLFNLYNSEPYKFTLSYKGAYSLFRFGVLTFLSRFVWTLHTRIDAFILGKMFSNQALGLYTIGKQFAAMPMDKLSGLINQVALAGFSEKNRTNSEKNDTHIVQSLAIVSVIMMPIFIGMSATAEPLVTLLVGEKWSLAIPIMSVMCLMMPFKMFGSLLDTYVASHGQPGFNLKVSVFYLVSTIIVFIVSAGEEITYVANLLVWVYLGCFHIVLGFICYKFHISFIKICRAYIYPVIWSLVMFVVINFATKSYFVEFDNLLLLITQVITGVICYGACVLLTGQSYVTLIVGLLRKSKNIGS